MNDSKASPITRPDVVLVVGGGRWARVFLDILCEIVAPKVRIIALTTHNAISLSDWLFRKRLRDRVEILPQLPEFSSPRSVAGIVVNAARDHEKAAEKLLASGITVLVEKPIALNSAAVARLEALALKEDVHLAGAYVFLYARYIDNFIKIISGAGEMRRVYVYWEDPSAESRHGEQKTYDPGLPIIADWLPHVLPIVEKIIASSPGVCKQLQLFRGGAHVELEIMFGEVRCIVQLIRNGSCRRRLIKVESDNELFELDFSKEPGIILADGAEICGDLEWERGPGPVTQMLTAFLRFSAGGTGDDRLDVTIGVRAIKVIDQVFKIYNSALVSWMTTRLTPPMEIDADLRYAFCEMLQYKKLLNKMELDECIEKVIMRFSGADSDYWINELRKIQDPSKIFDQLIAKPVLL